jgi:uncharacterized alpha-E superfamily protein
LLVRLKSRYILKGGNAAMERVDEIQAALHSRPVEDVIKGGLHEYLDWLQLHLNEVTREISKAFFGAVPTEALAEQEQ